MALIPHCDRCKLPGQIVTVLGMDLCGKCVEDTRAWLRKPFVFPLRKWRDGSRVNRVQQAANLLSHADTFTADQIAEMTGEPRKRAYNSMMFLVKLGHLEHKGRGVFSKSTAAQVHEIDSAREAAGLPVRRKTA
jgi:hypothetical protein